MPIENTQNFVRVAFGRLRYGDLVVGADLNPEIVYVDGAGNSTEYRRLSNGVIARLFLIDGWKGREWNYPSTYYQRPLEVYRLVTNNIIPAMRNVEFVYGYDEPPLVVPPAPVAKIIVIDGNPIGIFYALPAFPGWAQVNPHTPIKAGDIVADLASLLVGSPPETFAPLYGGYEGRTPIEIFGNALDCFNPAIRPSHCVLRPVARRLAMNKKYSQSLPIP